MNCYMFVSVGKHNTPDVCYVGDNIGSFYSYFFMDFFKSILENLECRSLDQFFVNYLYWFNRTKRLRFCGNL